MRVIAGCAKGRRLKTPRNASIRPTSDKVRGAIFDILGDIEDLAVLDLFAGTGAMGIEALSRGASRATFVDVSRSACDLVRENLATTKLEELAKVLKSDATSPAVAGETFDVILADPPYDFPSFSALLAWIPGVLAPDGILVVEHDARMELEETTDLEKVDSRRWGTTAATFFRHRNANQGAD